MARYTECPICHSWKISLHMVCKDHFLSGEKFQLYHCAECKSIFTQDHPAENEMKRYYESEEYISHSDTSKGLTNKLYRLVREVMLKRKRKIVLSETGLASGTLLDIGCGTGYFAAAMKDAGWQVTGVEVEKKARDFASSNFDLKVISPDQLNYIPSGTFDCITLWHVAEHFHDPFRYFSKILTLLKPDGICIAALPNSSSYDALYYREFWAAWDVPRHIWHFQPSSFDVFLKRTGFRCTGIRNMPFDVFYISILSEKYKGSRLYFLKGLFVGKIFFLGSLFNIKKSSSLIYLLRK